MFVVEQNPGRRVQYLLSAGKVFLEKVQFFWWGRIWREVENFAPPGAPFFSRGKPGIPGPRVRLVDKILKRQPSYVYISYPNMSILY